MTALVRAVKVVDSQEHTSNSNELTLPPPAFLSPLAPTLLELLPLLLVAAAGPHRSTPAPGLAAAAADDEKEDEEEEEDVGTLLLLVPPDPFTGDMSGETARSIAIATDDTSVSIAPPYTVAAVPCLLLL
jgi:hypothetical protein